MGRFTPGCCCCDKFRRAYAFAGFDAGVEYLASNEEYTPQTDSWATKTDLTFKRARSAGSSLAKVAGIVCSTGFIYGGITGGVSPYIDGILADCDGYTPKTDAWTAQQPMNGPSQVGSDQRSGRIFPAGVSLNSKNPTAFGCYSVGGQDSLLEESGGWSCQLFVPGSWTTLPGPGANPPNHLQYAASGSCGSAIGTNLYFTGGSYQAITIQESHLQLDGLANSAFVIKTPQPVSVTRGMALSFDASIFIVGGMDIHQTNTAVVDKYDETDTWAASTAVQPGTRAAGAGCVVKGKGYIYSGYLAGLVTADVEEFDPTAETWTAKTDIPTPRNDFVGTAI